MNYSYIIKQGEQYNPETRDMRPIFEVQFITAVQDVRTHTRVLASYTNRVAAELVISALRAAQNDLT